MITAKNLRGIEAANPIFHVTQRMAAIVVGTGLLLMFIAAMCATFVHGNVFVPGDAAATAHNIMANAFQFRLAILSFLIVIVLDAVVAWGLYVFFEPVNRNLSLLAGWFRLLYAAIFAVVILELGNALALVENADALAGLESDQVQTQVLLMFNAFSSGWDIALAIFGLHLILIGYLVLKSGFMPTILGALVIICGLGYTFDSITGFLMPDFGVTVSLFTFIGEILLALWLVMKGVSIKQWRKLTLESA